jgi:recombination DNA repair RAD52 pathway protein
MKQKYAELTDAQVKRTLSPVRSTKIETIQGASYVPHHEVRAELCRMFGPTRWDSQTEELVLVYENEEPNPNKQNETRWRVCYRAAVRLRVRSLDGLPLAEYREWHADESVHPSRAEAHTNALTSAQSVALRRAAINIGDNMGLHLYDQGSRAGIVRGTLLNNQVPQTVSADLSDEQKQTLADTLGASVVSESASSDQPAASDGIIRTPEDAAKAIGVIPSDAT